MPERNVFVNDEPLNLDVVRDELGRIPVIGRETDRELFVDLPSGGLGVPYGDHCRQIAERELLSNDFAHGG